MNRAELRSFVVSFGVVGLSFAAVACGGQGASVRKATSAEVSDASAPDDTAEGVADPDSGASPDPSPAFDAGASEAAATDAAAPDGASDGAVSSDASDSGASDSGSTASSAEAGTTAQLSCGPGLSCGIPAQVCCVNMDSFQGPSYSCVASALQCQGRSATSLQCATSANCTGGAICCITSLFGAYIAGCVDPSMCTDPDSQAELCDPNAASSGCPANAGPASTCSSDDIGQDWGLPSTFGTCGGQ